MSQINRARTSGLLGIERRILLLVMAGRRGKEIAPLVGTTYDMVEKYIKSAREKLGGVSRMEAARLVAADEGVEWVQKLDVQNSDLLPDPVLQQDPDCQQSETNLVRPGSSFPWPFETDGRSANELAVGTRWSWILILAFAIALMALGLVTATGSLLGHLARLL